MTNPLKLIDSSAFIEFSRERGDSQIADTVARAIEGGTAATCLVAAAEILSGCATRAEYSKVGLLLRGLIWLPVTAECWTRAAALGFNLRRKGITVPLTDRLIAVVARANDADLLHRDTHYDLIGDTPDEVAG